MLITWVAFLAYAMVAIALGWTARSRRDRGAAYWTANRRLGPLSVGLSMSAGFLSISWSCVYAVQLFYWYGLGAIWLITIPWLLALAGIHYLSSRYRALPAFSQPEMVRRRFGAAAQLVVALALVFVFLVWGGAEIHVAANLLAPGLGVSRSVMIVLISVVVGIYATLGGFRAVVSTDKLQYAVVVAYIIAMAALAYVGSRHGLPGAGVGPTAEISSMVTDPGNVAGLARGIKSGTPWSDLWAPGVATVLLTFAAYLPGWLFETDLWLRVQAARDRSAARRGVTIAMVNAFFFVGVLPAFIGITALDVFPSSGGFPPELGNEGDAIFVALVENFAPAWLGILVAVGLTAAAMSTIDTCANVMALSIAYDIGGLHEKPGGESLSQLVTAGCVAAAAVFAFNTESLWDIFYLSSGILTTTVAFPVAAVFLPWATASMVTASSAAGFVVTIVAYFLETRGYLAAIQPSWLSASGLGYILWGMVAAALAALVAAFVSGTHEPQDSSGAVTSTGR